ncbi:hypothetical protein [Paenarthrobacter sp. A20]|uniref:hypothetical protein n=1 Tax=Paenarthrobacter sp. A20 TaxID=2817891 RepID=UPI00209EE74D|nr:hypothetical protein [Paenarthrobacter sp. A20]MCP1413593.1 hypothetical protein [Paenarthrobacter sp. A20]
MQINPVPKPPVATPALIVASAVTMALALILAALALTVTGTYWLLLTVAAISVVLIVVWSRRLHGLRRWQSETDAQWKRLDGLKEASGTTTEITVLTVDAPQPTGAWVTIRWNRFNYIQPAWIEALPEPIWPGSVLLIRPDPAQVQPGAPWPETYRISGDHILAWAPLA